MTYAIGKTTRILGAAAGAVISAALLGAIDQYATQAPRQLRAGGVVQLEPVVIIGERLEQSSALPAAPQSAPGG